MNRLKDPNKLPGTLLAVMAVCMLVAAPTMSIAENANKVGQTIGLIIVFPAVIVFGIAFLIWVFSGWAGIYTLYKKGYFFGKGLGLGTLLLLLIFGWWFLIIVWELGSLAGAFLYKYAHNKPAKPRCPKCLTRNEVGATKCRACGSSL